MEVGRALKNSTKKATNHHSAFPALQLVVKPYKLSLKDGGHPLSSVDPLITLKVSKFAAVQLPILN
jgi:hypothetical protein